MEPETKKKWMKVGWMVLRYALAAMAGHELIPAEWRPLATILSAAAEAGGAL